MKRQRGFTLMEVIFAAGIGMLVLIAGAYVFIMQLRSYRDLDAVVKLQSDSKKAIEHMTREISNTGGLIVDPTRPGFNIWDNRVQVSYVDQRARYCQSSETVLITFRVGSGKGVDTLVQDVTCNGGQNKPRVLVKSKGAIKLAFQYFDLAGKTTNSRTKVQRVRLTLDLVTPKGKSVFQKTRKPQVDVDLSNY